MSGRCAPKSIAPQVPESMPGAPRPRHAGPRIVPDWELHRVGERRTIMGAVGAGTKRIARVLAVTGLVAGFLVAVPARRASASCVAIPSRQEAVDNAKFAFVGTVVKTSNRDR